MRIASSSVASPDRRRVDRIEAVRAGADRRRVSNGSRRIERRALSGAAGAPQVDRAVAYQEPQVALAGLVAQAVHCNAFSGGHEESVVHATRAYRRVDEMRFLSAAPLSRVA